MIMNRFRNGETINCTADVDTWQNSCSIPLLVVTSNWKMAMKSILIYLQANVIPVVIAVWALILAWKVFSRSGTKLSVYSLPPGPAKWPLLGNIPDLVFAGSSSKYLSDLVKRYGPTFTMYMGTRPVVVLNTYDSMKDALLDGHLLSARCPLPSIDSYFKGRGIIGAQYSNQDWKKSRSFAINSLKHFGVTKQCFEGVVASQAENVIDYIQTKYKGEPCEPLHFLQAGVCDVICGVIFGKQFDFENPRFTHLLETVHNSLRTIQYAAASSLVPGVRYLPGCSFDAFYSAMDTLNTFFREEIQEHDDLLDPDNPRDIIDLYLSELRRISPDDPSYKLFGKNNIEFVINDLFIAGTETTSNVLYWLILLVALHPEIQEKLHKEIDDVTADSKHVGMSDGQRMPYTKAVLEEALRYSSVAISVMRATTADTTIGGHRLEVGTWLMLNYEYSSFDPEMWDEPKSFRPERFLDEEGEFLSKKHLLAFSIGKRNCLGERLARMELFLFATNIFKTFELIFPESAPKPCAEARSGGMTRVPHRYQVCFKKRAPSVGGKTCNGSSAT